MARNFAFDKLRIELEKGTDQLVPVLHRFHYRAGVACERSRTPKEIELTARIATELQTAAAAVQRAHDLSAALTVLERTEEGAA